MQPTYDIELGTEDPDGEAFRAWLIAQGHTVKTCGGTRFYIDHVAATRANPDAQKIGEDLRAAFNTTT